MRQSQLCRNRLVMKDDTMTPREYVDEIVRPNLADLESDECNPRHALNAVHAVDALAARIYVAAGGRDVTGA